MSYKAQTKDKSQVEFTITVTPAEYDKHMKNAATRISERVAIKGFRKGKAPYDLVKKEVGDMQIMQEAMEAIIQESFYAAVKEEGIETIGMPDIKVEKVAPGNDLLYTATVALVPEVKLPDLSKISIKKETKDVTDTEIDETLDNLRKMQAKEVDKEDGSASTKEDIMIIDMELYLDGVIIEGGTAKDYKVYLSENQHIPGFNEALLGLKKDEEKEFTVPFPENYYNKQLAGNDGTFKIKVKAVQTRDLPEMNEDFAKALGQESVKALRELLQKNLEHEALHKAEQTAEIKMFDALIEKTSFGDIPKVLVDAERQKMFYELSRDLEKNGITVEQYLNDIKKSEEDLQKDFTDKAEKRAKAALLSRQVAKDENLDVSDEEMAKEMKLMEDTYKHNPEYLENLKKPEVKESIYNMLVNKKVVAHLKKQTVEGGEHVCEHDHNEK